METVLRGKFIALNVNIRKEERSKINLLSFHLRKLGKGEQVISKVSRKKGIIKIRAETNEIENRKSIEKSKTKAGSLKISKILISF